MRVVLDTDVTIAAMCSPRGASARKTRRSGSRNATSSALLRATRSASVTLLLSVALAIEYEAVCHEPEHQIAAGLSPQEVSQFVTAVIALAEPVTIHYLWRPQLRDPNDEMVLEVAVNGQADAIVTFNRKDYGSVTESFNLEVLLPAQMIKRI